MLHNNIILYCMEHIKSKSPHLSLKFKLKDSNVWILTFLDTRQTQKRKLIS